MRILGIFDDHNAGCAIIEDGKILAAVEEERLSRIKLHNGNVDGSPFRTTGMRIGTIWFSCGHIRTGTSFTWCGTSMLKNWTISGSPA